MNTKLRLKNLRKISPDYPRIPHFDKSISNMTHDDIILESSITYPLECWVQEKVDGANMGVSWTSGPVLRNRNHILKKGYMDVETPSKIQFRPAWNWLHEHRKDIMMIIEALKSPITVYGEWLWAKHSIGYDKLPDWFLAYDIYLAEEDNFISPSLFKEIISKTNIKFIDTQKVILNNIQDVINLSERKSKYRNDVCEGIVIKTSSEKYLSNSFKVVNKHFKRIENFNDELIKNKII
jgi:hypothetical protein